MSSARRPVQMLRCWLTCCALLLGSTALAQNSWLPIDPGAARCTAGGESATLENAALRFTVAIQDARLRLQNFDNRLSGAVHPLTGELYSLEFRDGRRLAASAMRIAGRISCDQLPAAPAAVRGAARRAGVQLTATLKDERTGLLLEWRLIL